MAAPASSITIHVEDTDKGESRLNQLIKLCRDPSTKEDDVNRVLQLRNSADKTTLLDTKSKEGTTALHEACCYGNTHCIKAILKNGGCATIWDTRGFTPLHCAAYNGHLEAIKDLLEWTVPPDDHNQSLTPDELSEFDETSLHIACMRGHLNVAKHLIQANAEKTKLDAHKNTVFHYAVSSNNGRLLMWLIELFGGAGNEEMKKWLTQKNKFGQTPAHRAAILGCVMSISTIIQFVEDAIFKVKDNTGHTAIDLAEFLGNRECQQIANGKKPPKPLPRTPPTHRGSISQSMESLGSRRDSLLQPQRSLSNGDSTQSTSSASPTLKRRNSTTRSKRPVNFGVPLARIPSFQGRGSRVGSISSRLSGADNTSRTSIDLENLNFVTVSKDTAKRVTLKKQESTWEETTQLMFDSTTYEPPLDIPFIPPIKRDTLTRDKPRMFSLHHDIKLRVSQTYWTKNNLQDEALETCLCAAMQLNQSYPQGYVIVSPICFVSCKSRHACEISLSLPHAVREEDASKLCVLSTSMGSARRSAGSPLFSPSERLLVELPRNAINGLEHKGNCVNFRISIHYPCLFVLAVNIKVKEEGSVPRPLVPLRCVLYVWYPVLDRTRSVSRVYITSYVGLALKTVATEMSSRQGSKSRMEDDHLVSKSFLMSESVVQVSGSLNNHHDNWELWCMGDEEFKYNEVALTQDLGNDSYSYKQPYPPQQMFFLSPKNPTRAIKCKIAVADSKQELASVFVIPYAPVKEPTPEPSPLSSQPSSTHSSLTLLPHANSHGTVV